jgi:coenzyme PQQ precursor peptide PqqA
MASAARLAFGAALQHPDSRNSLGRIPGCVDVAAIPFAHTAIRTDTPCGTKLQGQLSGSFEFTHRSVTMKWETPAAAEIRFGFEITMYVANR